MIASFPELEGAGLAWRDGVARAADAPATYWGELPEAEFTCIAEAALTADDVDLALMRLLRDHRRWDLYPYACDIAGRCDWTRVLRLRADGVALDVGAGLGAITIGLAATQRRVYAVEGCAARCSFIAARLRRRGLANAAVIHADVHRLPLPDASVDLVACNGVLEWVAQERPGAVAEVQRAFLAELRRVLRPDGILYVGIEHRWALAYLRGLRDHPGRRWLPWMPRDLADLCMRMPGGDPAFIVRSPHGGYRTWTHSEKGYRRLLAAAGFADVACYAVEPSYDFPGRAIPRGIDHREADAFLHAFHGRGLRTWQDLRLCSCFILFASPTSLAGRTERRPTWFGFGELLRLDGGQVERTMRDGRIVREDLLGANALRAPMGDLDSTILVQAHAEFLATPRARRARADLRSVVDVARAVAADLLAPGSLDRLFARIDAEHCAQTYHGDLFLGNIVRGRDGRPALIDPEDLSFGSPALDAIDVVLDLARCGRWGLVPAFDGHAFRTAYNIAPKDTDILAIAVLRKIVRYSPRGRPHAEAIEWLRLLPRCRPGGFDPWSRR